jgi:hypothetical protein
MFEERVLKRIFRLNTENVKRCWRKIHSKELCNLYSSSDIISMTKSKRSTNGEMRNAYKFFVGKPERKRPLR